MQQARDSGASCLSLEDMVNRRLTGEPLQYILGLQHIFESLAALPLTLSLQVLSLSVRLIS